MKATSEYLQCSVFTNFFSSSIFLMYEMFLVQAWANILMSIKAYKHFYAKSSTRWPNQPEHNVQSSQIYLPNHLHRIRLFGTFPDHINFQISRPNPSPGNSHGPCARTHTHSHKHTPPPMHCTQMRSTKTKSVSMMYILEGHRCSCFLVA